MFLMKKEFIVWEIVRLHAPPFLNFNDAGRRRRDYERELGHSWINFEVLFA